MENKGPIRQIWSGALIQAQLSDNRLRVIACTIGTPLLNSYVLFPGSFTKAARKGMVQDGALLVGHNWDELPIGMIMDASDQGQQLVCEAQFHQTDRGQEARTICKERLDAGKSVSVSIGYFPDWDKVMFFESGTKLLAFAEANGYDMKQFDSKALKAYDGYLIGITQVDQLVEFSLVIVGADPQAKALEVQGLTFDQQFTGALEALGLVVDRWEKIAQKREQLGPTHREKLLQLLERLEPIAQLSEPDPDPEPEPDSTPEPETQSDERYAALAFRTLSHRTAAARAS